MHFEMIEIPRYDPRFNIAPTQTVAALRAHPQGRLETMRWGLSPRWTRPGGRASILINARAETIDNKPTFHEAFRHRRCLVLADGFYEWQRRGRARRPFVFRLRDNAPFAFAGLWQRTAGADGAPRHACLIITTTANPLLAKVHDRMPVILHPTDYALWLDERLSDTKRLASVLRPYPHAEMTSLAVGPHVNSAGHEGPECIVPAGHTTLFP
jgi:putative SOS response-associated peptidase YedK